MWVAGCDDVQLFQFVEAIQVVAQPVETHLKFIL